MYKLIILLLLIALVAAFDKNLIRKGKRDPTEKHPISRRVLRFERSASDDFADFDLPQQSMIDFAKSLPELPVKLKNYQTIPTEYTDMDF